MATTIDLPNKAYMLPDSIPNWPPAWWFWLVLAAVITLFVLAVIALRRRHGKRTYRREALQQLNDCHELSDQALTSLCLTLMKRCLITEGKEDMASLTTQQLLPLLDQQCKSSRHPLSALEDSFSSAIYMPNGQLTTEQREALTQATRLWIRRHRA